MVIVKTKYIPFGEYTAMTIWPFIFTKIEMPEYVERHEYIHGEQQKEMLLLLFPIVYYLEWLIKRFFTKSWMEANEAISFEQEAFNNQHDRLYLEKRKHYNWVKFIFKV